MTSARGQSDGDTLFDRLGGRDAVEGAISAFYGRVLRDPELSPFFAGADMDKLHHMQSEFFTVALGGSGTYAGMSLAEAHRGRGIQARHLSLFADHMLDTMLERGMPADAVDEVVARITVIGQDVLDTANEAG
jgi:hemoglobin